MKSGAARWLRLPAGEGWQWWHSAPGEAAAEPVERRDTDEPAVFAFPTPECHSVPIWVSSPDPALIERVVVSELDRVGLPSSTGPGRHHAWHVVQVCETQSLVQAVVIPAEMESTERSLTEWAGFSPAAFFFPPPPREVVLWQEHGRWIVAFSREGRWVHFQNLGTRPLDAGLLGEIRCLLLELEGREMTEPPDALTHWRNRDAPPPLDDVPPLAEKELGIGWQERELPTPGGRMLPDWEPLLPADIAEIRTRRKQARRTMWAAMLIALVCAACVALGWGDLWRQAEENRIMRERIAERKPDAGWVRRVRERWRALEPALEVHRHPVELFHRVASHLPEDGIRLTSFELSSENQIVVRGEATNVPMAIRLKSDLEESAGLRDYGWEIPPPEIDGDTATFVAIGNYRYGEVVQQEP